LVDKDGNGELSPADFMTLCFKLTMAPESIDIQTCKFNLITIAKHLGVQEFTKKPRKVKQALKMKEIRRSRTELAMAIGYKSIWEGEEPEPEEDKKSSKKKSKKSKKKQEKE
jgi:hypothetical protein